MGYRLWGHTESNTTAWNGSIIKDIDELVKCLIKKKHIFSVLHRVTVNIL